MLCRPFGDLSRVWLCYVGPLVKHLGRVWLCYIGPVALDMFGYVMGPLVLSYVWLALC